MAKQPKKPVDPELKKLRDAVAPVSEQFENYKKTGKKLCLLKCFKSGLEKLEKGGNDVVCKAD